MYCAPPFFWYPVKSFKIYVTLISRLDFLGLLKSRVENLGSLNSRLENLGHLKSRLEYLGHLKSWVENLGILKSRVENLGVLKSRVENLGVLKSQGENLGYPKISTWLFRGFEVEVDPISPSLWGYFFDAPGRTGASIKCIRCNTGRCQSLFQGAPRGAPGSYVTFPCDQKDLTSDWTIGLVTTIITFFLLRFTSKILRPIILLFEVRMLNGNAPERTGASNKYPPYLLLSPAMHGRTLGFVTLLSKFVLINSLNGHFSLQFFIIVGLTTMGMA